MEALQHVRRGEMEEACKAVDAYQAQPELLDEVLEEIVCHLFGDCPERCSDGAYRVLYTLCKVRGRKVVVRFFPHHVSLIHTILRLCPQPGIWEATYCHLLWLSVLLLVPFDLDSIASDLVNTVHDIVRPYTMHDGPLTLPAATVLANLYSRPDTSPNFDRLLDPPVTTFSLRFAAQLLKHASSSILPQLQTTTQLVETLARQCSSSSTLARKLAIKCIQRIGKLLWTRSQSETRYYRPLELCISCLLDGIQDESTVVRWSAAKGLGRITCILPSMLSLDVVEAVLCRFVAPSAAARQGACLTLAELLVRQAIPLDLGIRQHLLHALHFDPQAEKARSATVRDAACYSLWAMSRSYPCATIASECGPFAADLIQAALCDRDINVRRAACAAFQEAVGRLGEAFIANGIAIIGIVDFWSVSSLSRCYRELCPQIAGYKAYASSLLDHLKTRCLVHWDTKVRTLAAECLGTIAAAQWEHMGSALVTEVLFLIDHGASRQRHGSLCCLGHLIKPLALHGADETRWRSIHRVCASLVQQAPHASTEDAAAMIHVYKNLACYDTTSNTLEPSLLSSLEFFTRSETPSLAHLALEGMQAYFTVHTPTSITIKRYTSALLEPHSFPVVVRYFVYLPAALLPSHTLLPLLTTAVQSTAPIETRIHAFKALIHQAMTRQGTIRDVFPIVLACMLDKTVDKRGDVGSWMREAAMEAGASLVDDVTASDYVGLVLLQMCTLRDRMVQCAQDSLERVLARVRVPEENMLRSCIERLDFTTLIPSRYGKHVVHGYCLAIGGLTKSAAQQASTIMITYLCSCDTDTLATIGDMVVELLEYAIESESVAVLQACGTLLGSGCFEELEVPYFTFAQRIHRATVQQLNRKPRPILKYKACTLVLTELLVYSAPICTDVIRVLVKLLGNRYPVIRQYAAEQMYEKMAVLGLQLDRAVQEEAHMALLETSWKTAEFTRGVQTLSRLFGVGVKASTMPTVPRVAHTPKGFDYSSFVEDVSRPVL